MKEEDVLKEALEIDKEDVESDMNTFVDVAGDNVAWINVTENVTLPTNKKIYLGDNQEGEIYYDGSKLIIKV